MTKRRFLSVEATALSRWFRFRVWIADRLDSLAFRVCPACPALSMSELVERQRNLNDAVRLMVEREIRLSAPAEQVPSGAALKEDA